MTPAASQSLAAAYCHSRFRATRWRTRPVPVGKVTIGGDAPIVVQSMTTTDTLDVDATVRQAIALAEVGRQLVRITAPSTKAARALGDIRRQLDAAHIDVPLAADIHFTPSAAMEAVEHVEKVRVNPGNYADRKKFKTREYTDDQYESELQRLHETFSPLVKRCKELGRAMRIGTNHGSLSDRIMNRYGDSPLGMVESALEFIRIAESHGFHDIVLSMKASNPKVMIEAYRLAVAKMTEEGMRYPLHLGVTEAGDGEDGRIKSAVGIGTLLYDGLGDTIRVSLTEDPVYEIPVARDLAARAMRLWEENARLPDTGPALDGIDPFDYQKRETQAVTLAPGLVTSSNQPPRVIVRAHLPLGDAAALEAAVRATQKRLKDNRIEALLLRLESADALQLAMRFINRVGDALPCVALEVPADCLPGDLPSTDFPSKPSLLWVRRFAAEDAQAIRQWAHFAALHKHTLALDTTAEALPSLMPALDEVARRRLLLTQSAPQPSLHPLGSYRRLADTARRLGLRAPLWIRNTPALAIQPEDDFYTAHLLEASSLSGALLCDGLGDLLSIEAEPDLFKAANLAYGVLQGAKARISKTEFVACPSCGRTLFDLQTTTQAIRAKTGHLKNVTIAVMGCIVNGPGEMADADFGYVGGAPGKVNLYVGKTPVKYNVPEAEAVDRLVDLIREHGKWIDPPTEDDVPEPALASAT